MNENSIVATRARQTGFWNAEEPCEELEKLQLAFSGMTADIFLHGICGFFALALHERFGYEIRFVYDENEYKDLLDDSDCETPSPFQYLTHIYCVKEMKDGSLAYIDIRGVTTDEEAFFGEYDDFLTDRDESEYPESDLRDDINEVNDKETVRKFMSDAVTFINEHIDFYKMK